MKLVNSQIAIALIITQLSCKFQLMNFSKPCAQHSRTEIQSRTLSSSISDAEIIVLHSILFLKRNF